MRKILATICSVISAIVYFIGIGGSLLNILEGKFHLIYSSIALVFFLLVGFLFQKLSKMIKKNANLSVKTKSNNKVAETSKVFKRLDYCLVRDLLAITISQNGLSPHAKKNILEIMKSRNIQEQVFDEVLALDPDNISDCYPETQQERELYLFSVAYAMSKDNITPQRKKYLNIIALKMNLSPEDVYLTLEDMNATPV